MQTLIHNWYWARASVGAHTIIAPNNSRAGMDMLTGLIASEPITAASMIADCIVLTVRDWRACRDHRQARDLAP
jgi:hypothetical protein